MGNRTAFMENSGIQKNCYATFQNCEEAK